MANKVNQYDDENVERRYELLAILVTFARENKGALPIQRRAWLLCCAAGYDMGEKSFERHWKQLKEDGFIAVEPQTNTPYIPQSQWSLRADMGEQSAEVLD